MSRKVNWIKLDDDSYKGIDEDGNTYYSPSNQETVTVIRIDGRVGIGWNVEDAWENAKTEPERGKK